MTDWFEELVDSATPMRMFARDVDECMEALEAEYEDYAPYSPPSEEIYHLRAAAAAAWLALRRAEARRLGKDPDELPKSKDYRDWLRFTKPAKDEEKTDEKESVDSASEDAPSES